MKTFKIKSHAKLNLALHVTGKSSKLHKLESIVTFIDLHDLIYIKPSNSRDHKISFIGKFSKNIKKDNTVMCLLRLLDKERFLKNKKFNIKIFKNIPQKSGMGGGSMNASSMINFFIKKKIIQIKKKQLIKLSNSIGSDVILGINPTNTILSSNGKITRYKKRLKLYPLVVKPNFGCSTRYIFSKLKYYSKSKFNLPKQLMFKENYLKSLGNDLEIVAFKRYPRLKNIKSFLTNASDVIFVRMSGSGSSIVAYFHSKKACNNALKQFKSHFNSHWCIASKTI
jgi:4-diphosphocytidyl-2-C-methyl-D-erythritol kinase